MRAVQTRAPAVSSSPKKGRSVPGPRLPGLRWVPVPLALLVVALGLLVLGSRQGQAAADLASHPNQAGGLSLSVDAMLWMSNDVDGSGAPASANVPGQAAPAPGDPKQFTMPDSMMPGMQPTGDDRLRVEVDLNNVTSSVQKYSTTDFTLSAPGGKTWQVNGQEHSSQPAWGNLQPGFAATVDLYFDVQAADIKNLTLHWSRGGRTISMPVNTNGQAPAGMHM
jgi:hypothetical protein